MKVGILTVSDKGSRGEREDTSGPALERSVHSIGG
ncbi:MAG: molybdenum cofactor biosynthesis protein, partial [Synergistaceae bacterium]|nr:molybdenum cofactor biosynthesis protein [Synergistaceae bacterium]